jgi:hypothetical protein
MANYPSNISTETYHYDSQLRSYIVQFMAVFAGLKVSVGENDFDKQSNLIDVPIRYGSVDRVVAAVKADNTQNKPVRLPTMAAYLASIQMAPEARKGVNVVERRPFLERGASFPNDIRVIEREQPIPYIAVFDLSIMTSNTDQHYQILEQILTLFNPIIQIQTSDDVHDWKRITTVELTDIGLEENYPPGQDNRIIQTTLSFVVPIYMAPPTVINRNYVAEIKMRLAAVAANESVTDIVSDITRTFPAYEDLGSVKDLKFPTS